MVKCAIYCRISREDESADISGSILNQRSLLTETARQNGWEIYNIYIDEDWSGADGGRPAFLQMLSDAEAGRFNVLLCKSQSRFARDMELIERFIHGKFPLWGIRFIAPADNDDTELPGNKKSRQINALVNQWYLEDLSENIRMVLDMKRRAGAYIGAFALYGYEKAPEKSVLRIDETAAPVVRLIFRLGAAGLSTRSIARLLDQAAIPNPAAHKLFKGNTYINGGGQGRHWSGATVWRMLSNDMYTGIMVQGRKRKPSYKSPKTVPVPPEKWFRVEGTHPAIISQEEFQSVRDILKKRCPGTCG